MSTNDTRSFILAGLPSLPAFFTTFETPSTWNIFVSIVLPIMFFVASKIIDVKVKIYLANNRKGRKEIE